MADRTDSRIDDLYREAPEGFTKARDRFAKELKDGGDAERGAEVRRLRKPTNAAFVVNRLGLEHPKEVGALADASEKMRAAYEGGDGDEMRVAAAAERNAVSRLVTLAEDEAAAAKIPTTSALMDRVTETLQAFSGDEETRRLVQSGRLDRERKVATLGFPVGTSGPSRARKAKRPAIKPGRELEAARKELRRVERELKSARGRQERAKTTVKRAEAKLADAKTEAAGAGEDVARLEADAKRLRKRIDSLG